MDSSEKKATTSTVDTFPVSGTTMTYGAGDNTLSVSSTAGDKTYSSGSILKISINDDAEYEVEDPGPLIRSYNYNKGLSHTNLQCFKISNRSGIGVTDFRDFKIKDTWDLDDCHIGLELADSELKIGFNSNTPPCFTEEQVDEADCDG